MAVKSYLKFTLTISLFSLILLVTTNVHTATMAEVPNANYVVEDNIEYYVQTDKSVYELHETVDMLYRVANVGDEDVKFSIVRYLNEPTCIFEVLQGSSRIWTNQPSRVVYVSVDASFTLKPDENAEFSEIWNMYDESNSLINTGQYDIVSYLHLPSTDKRYVPVSVSINVIHKPATHYVKNGESIQLRIDDPNVVDGDIIIVFPGTYFENINFNGKNITLRSTDPNDPNVVAATIIDGGQNGSVVTFNSGEDANCVLNGFTITNGYAEFGGGIYCASPPLPPPPGPPPPPPPPPPPSPGILNEQSSPEILSEPVLPGPVIKNCIINNNSADSGGGMYNDQSNPTLSKCTFSGNYANYNGGGMSNRNSSPALTKCIFIDNSTIGVHGMGYGGGMYNYYSSPTLTNCTFSVNSAPFSGGGMYNLSSNPIMTYCTFSGNSAPFSGGGMCNWQCSPTLTNCIFRGNSSSGSSGGGMYNYGSSPTLTYCTFCENWTRWNGGAIYNGKCQITMTNCLFSENLARAHGGAMFDSESQPILTNCTFSGNLALREGGGIYLHRSSTSNVYNCILWENEAENGREIYLGDGSFALVQYTNIQSGQKKVYVEPDCELIWGRGNIDADPCFVRPGYSPPPQPPLPPPSMPASYINDNSQYILTEPDYRLLPGSPCINAGDPNYIADLNETDLDGNPRIVGCRIDMGAYEYGQLVPSEVKIVPSTINLQSKVKWITFYICPPEEYDVVEIDSNSIFLECEIEPESLHVNEQQQVVTASFNREDVQGVLDVGDIELTVTGRFMDGTLFEGAGLVRIQDKGAKK